MVDISRVDQTLIRGFTSQALYFAAISRALASRGIITGGKVQQRAAGANMSVDVDELYYVVSGKGPTKISATNMAVSTADPTNPRIDFLHINSGEILYVAPGVAKAVKPIGENTWQEYEEPYPVDFSPYEGIPLALIHVGAGVTSITNANIQMIGQLIDLNVSGWIPWRGTWTYAGVQDEFSTFTVSGDQTAIFTEATKIKLTQTTEKFFVVVKSEYSSPNTTVTVWGHITFSLVNAAITNPVYSREESPAAWPGLHWESNGWTPFFLPMVYVSYDASVRTGVVKCVGHNIAVGMMKEGQKIKFYQSGSMKFAFVTKAEYSGGDSYITLFMHSYYSLANAAIDNFFTSDIATPQLFPLDRADWRLYWGDADTHSQATPTAWTYYNLNSEMSYVPVGLFNIEYGGDCQIAASAEGDKSGLIVIAEAVGGTGWVLSHALYFFNTDAAKDRIPLLATQKRYAAKQAIYLLAMTMDSGLSSIGVIGHYCSIIPAYLPGL